MRLPFVAIIVLLACIPGVAQGPMNLFGVQAKVFILARQDVKKELNVTRDQQANIDRIARETGGEPSFNAGVSLPYPLKALDEKVGAVLEPPQRARLQELFLQFNGHTVLRLEEIAEGLGINEETRTAIDEIARKADADCVAAVRQSKGRMNSKQIQAIRLGANEKAKALLSPAQVDAWAKACGPTFAFKF